MFYHPVFQYAPFLAGLLNLVVAVIVYRRDAAYKVNRRFSLFCLSIALWNLGAFFEECLAVTPASILFWSKISHFGGTFAAPLGLHFVLRFTRSRSRAVQKWLVTSYAISFCCAILIFSTQAIIRGAVQYAYGHHAVRGPLYPLHLTNLIVNVSLTFFLLLTALRRSTSNVERNRLRYGLWGFTILMLTSLLNFLPAFGYNTFAPGHVGTVIFLLLILFGIYRYRLMNIQLAFARYGLLLVFWITLGLLYSLIFHGAGHLFPPGLMSQGRLLFNFVVAGLFLLVYQLMAQHALPRIEKLVYPLKSDLRKRMPELDHRIVQASSSREVAAALLDIAFVSVHVPAAVVYLRSGFENLEFRLYGTRGNLPETPLPLLPPDYLLTRQTGPLIREEIKRDIELESLKGMTRAAAEQIIGEFDRLGMEALIPLAAGTETIGLLFFSRKRLGGVYDPDDLDALKLLATRAAAAISNFETSASLKEKEHLARVGEMTAAIAHEIKNPLGVIRSAAEKLSPLPGETARLSGMILEETARLDTIVRSFLAYVRPQTASVEAADVGRLLARCTELFLSESRATAYSIRLPEAPVAVKAVIDPDLFKQVFYNIIHNSLDAKAGGETRITVEADIREVRLSFSDNCGGMPKETLDKIFQPFFTTKAAGTGLGMAIVRKLVLAMKGKIYITSEAGRGTAVNLAFPCSNQG